MFWPAKFDMWSSNIPEPLSNFQGSFSPVVVFLHTLTPPLTCGCHFSGGDLCPAQWIR